MYCSVKYDDIIKSREVWLMRRNRDLDNAIEYIDNVMLIIMSNRLDRKFKDHCVALLTQALSQLA